MNLREVNKLADTTKNYKLNKPTKNDYVSIDVLNQNMDIVDANLKRIEETVSDNLNFDFGDISKNKGGI